jgi:hypothetical protein
MKLSVPFRFCCDLEDLKTPKILDDHVYLGRLPDMATDMPWLAYLCETSVETTLHAFYDPAPHEIAVVYFFTITEKQQTFYNLKYGSY